MTTDANLNAVHVPLRSLLADNLLHSHLAMYK